MNFDFTSLTSLLGLIATFNIGAFILNLYKLWLDSKRTTQEDKIKDITDDLAKAFKSIEDLQKQNLALRTDNERLHNEINKLKENNATLRGLLSSQEDRDEAIKAYLSKSV